jgi:hypothetical protein
VFKLFTDESLSLREDMHKPITRPNEIDIIRGPVNGLYCISYTNRESEESHKALWNPSTSEFRELPSPPSSAQLLNASLILHYGKYLGFGFAGQDIKVIDITILFTDNDYIHGSRDALIYRVV